MQLYRFEMKKLFSSRVLIRLLVSLILINFGVVYFNTVPLPAKDYEMAVYEMVREDPEGTREYKKKLDEYYFNAIRASANKEEDPEMPKTYFPESPYDDSRLLGAALNYAEVVDGYEERMHTIIGTSQRQLNRLLDYGYREDHFSIVSRRQLIETYTTLLEQDSRGDDYTYGYDQYLSSSTATGVLLLVFLSAMIAYLFLSEDSLGTRPLTHATVKGRGQTALAKMFTVAGSSLAVSLLFFGTAALAVGIRCGFSSPWADIRLVEGCETVPFARSIALYLVVHTLLRLLGYLTYTLLCAALAALKLPYIGCFLGGGAVVGAQYAIWAATYLGTAPPIRYLNMISLFDGATPLSFFRTVSLFGICVNQITFLVCLALLLCVVFAICGVVLYSKNLRSLAGRVKRLGATLAGGIQKSRAHLTRRAERTAARRTRRYWQYSVALVPYEWKKIHLAALLLVIAALLYLKCAFVADDVGNMQNYFQTRYRTYISELQPLSTEEQEAYLVAERARLDDILEQYDTVQTSRWYGHIESEEYFAYMELYHAAISEESIFEEVQQYVEMVHRGNKATGAQAKIIYDTGYNHYFTRDMDVFLLIALIALCYGIFTIEYSEKGSQSGFSAILRSTRRGRERTFCAKLWACVPLCACVSFAFRLCDYFTIRHGFEMTDLDTYLYSVRELSVTPMTMTLGDYLLLDFILSALVGALLGYLFCALSAALRHKLPTLSGMVVLVGIPALLYALLAHFPQELALLALTQPQTMYAYISRGTGYFVLLMLIYTVLVGLLLYDRYRRFVGVRSMKI